jgi:ferredoxin
MRLCVDRSKCMRHGQCTIAAPALFSLGDDGELVVVEHPSEDQRAAAEDAADACPEQAIGIEE